MAAVGTKYAAEIHLQKITTTIVFPSVLDQNALYRSLSVKDDLLLVVLTANK